MEAILTFLTLAAENSGHRPYETVRLLQGALRQAVHLHSSVVWQGGVARRVEEKVAVATRIAFGGATTAEIRGAIDDARSEIWRLIEPDRSA